MKFDRPQIVSYKPFDNGEYVGLIVGFSYIGTHASARGPKPKCMLRWEIHELREPHDLCVDDEGLTQVVTQTFPATIRGDSAWLYKCLVAHGIAIPGGSVADSHDWYARAARLKVEGVPGNQGDKVFMNVIEINALDHDVNIEPVLSFEHWESEDTVQPPIWAKFMIERSDDLYMRVNPANASSAPDQDRRQTSHASQTNGGGAPARRTPEPQHADYEEDENDIPFNRPLERPEDNPDWIGLKW